MRMLRKNLLASYFFFSHEKILFFLIFLSVSLFGDVLTDEASGGRKGRYFLW